MKQKCNGERCALSFSCANNARKYYVTALSSRVKHQYPLCAGTNLRTTKNKQTNGKKEFSNNQNYSWLLRKRKRATKHKSPGHETSQRFHVQHPRDGFLKACETICLFFLKLPKLNLLPIDERHKVPDHRQHFSPTSAISITAPSAAQTGTFA